MICLVVTNICKISCMRRVYLYEQFMDQYITFEQNTSAKNTYTRQSIHSLEHGETDCTIMY